MKREAFLHLSFSKKSPHIPYLQYFPLFVVW